MQNNLIALTPGEPSGVGIELIYHLAQTDRYQDIVVIGSKALIQKRIIQTFSSIFKDKQKTQDKSFVIAPEDIVFTDYAQGSDTKAGYGCIRVLNIDAYDESVPGVLNIKNAPYVLNTLDRAIDGCLSGEFKALVTGPISKAVIDETGLKFTGHTEYLMQKSKAEHVVMMLGCSTLNVALVTTHLPLADIPSAINYDLIYKTVKIIDSDFKRFMGVKKPRILISGLNPHAGEGGHLGTEEIDFIIPCINDLQKEGIDIKGPYPADTMFCRHNLDKCDVFLTMYHDQGLPVLKFAGFDDGFNTTLGLPFIRTSVDHGTAPDIAGTGSASPNSLFVAIDKAIDMIKHGYN